MTLKLKNFDMKSISFKTNENKAPTILLIGHRDTSKSYLVRDLLYYYQDIPVRTVISGTVSVNGFFGEHVPTFSIHNQYKASIIESILERQKTVLKQKKEEDLYKKSTIDPRALIVLDDCPYPSWSCDNVMRLLFMYGRNWKMMLIITMQYPLNISPIFRANIDYVFILREPNISNRKKIYENYAGMFPTFESFCEIMDQCKENNECIVINNTSSSIQLSDLIFSFKLK